MYKNIIFDFGGVVVNFNPRDFLMDHFMNRRAEEETYDIVFGSQEWQDLDRGIITREEANKIMLEKAAHAVLDKAGLAEADIDWLIPHQANIRIMQGTARKLKLSMDKVVVTVDQHGNTSAASIPLALDHAVRNGQVTAGQTVLLEGVGGGFTWGAVLLKM